MLHLNWVAPIPDDTMHSQANKKELVQFRN